MLRKRLMTLALAVVMTVSVFTGCGSKDDSKTSGSESTKTEQQKSDAKKEKAAEKEETKAPIEDGTYTAEFKTDSSMFHVNDAYDDKGTLTVKDGKMTIHISLVSKNIVNLFPGTIKDAKKKGAKLLQPTTDTITDENGNAVIGIDGKPKEVYGLDVPGFCGGVELANSLPVIIDGMVNAIHPIPLNDGSYKPHSLRIMLEVELLLVQSKT